MSDSSSTVLEAAVGANDTLTADSNDLLVKTSWTYWFAVVFTSLLSLQILLFYVKTPIQFYVKYFTYVCITMAFSTCCIPVAMFRPNDPRNIYMVSVVLTALFKIFRIKVNLEDAKYLQISQPYILICNHQSSLDFLTMMSVWPGGYCTPLAKKELLLSGPFGIAIWLCGITFIDRLNHEKAKGTIDQLAERINRENLRVWIYPEGTRNLNTQLLPFKKGAFYLAIQAQIPIVSVVTSSYLNFYSKKEKKWLPSGEVRVKVLPPFQTKGMTVESVGQLTKHLQERMQKEFDALNEEIGLEKKYYNTSPSVAVGAKPVVDKSDSQLNATSQSVNNDDSHSQPRLNEKLNYSSASDETKKESDANGMNGHGDGGDEDEDELVNESSLTNHKHKSMSFSDDNNNSITDIDDSKR